MQAPRRENTRTALIRAAERLYAEKGLGGVSVRDITRAAGARNESALHYHFGGVDALIREVFACRYRDIEKARLTAYAHLDAAGKGDDVGALLEAAVRPLFEACREEDGRLYARFCVQLATDPRFDVVQLVQDVEMTSATIIRERAFAALRNLPQETLTTRLRRLFAISMILVADHARQVETGTAPPVEQAIEEARISLLGFLRAEPNGPPSQ